MAEVRLVCIRGSADSPCEGDVFLRTSLSGLTVAPCCEKHDAELAAFAAGVAERYPEVNHPEGCVCYGCSEGSY
jgi:hypothetical protein